MIRYELAERLPLDLLEKAEMINGEEEKVPFSNGFTLKEATENLLEVYSSNGLKQICDVEVN